VMAGVLVLAAVALSLDQLLIRLESHLSRWRGR